MALSWRPPPRRHQTVAHLWLGGAKSVPAVGTPRATSLPVCEQAPPWAQKRLTGLPVCAELQGSRGLRVPGMRPRLTQCGQDTVRTQGSREPRFLRAFTLSASFLQEPDWPRHDGRSSPTGVGSHQSCSQAGPRGSLQDAILGTACRGKLHKDFLRPVTGQTRSLPIFTHFHIGSHSILIRNCCPHLTNKETEAQSPR